MGETFALTPFRRTTVSGFSARSRGYAVGAAESAERYHSLYFATVHQVAETSSSMQVSRARVRLSTSVTPSARNSRTASRPAFSRPEPWPLSTRRSLSTTLGAQGEKGDVVLVGCGAGTGE